MSAVIILAPAVIGAWPVVSAAVVSAVGAMGYTAISEGVDQARKLQAETQNCVDIDIDNSEVMAESMTREEQMVFNKGDVSVTFKKDVRGKLKISVIGAGKSKQELSEIGSEIAGKVSQQFIYNKVVSELQETDLSIIDQEVDNQGTIRIQLRSWEDK